jgi:hypothetical protein
MSTVRAKAAPWWKGCEVLRPGADQLDELVQQDVLRPEAQGVPQGLIQVAAEPLGVEAQPGGLVEEGLAAQGQVVLEVVQHQQDPVVGEQALELLQADRVREPLSQQQITDAGELRVCLDAEPAGQGALPHPADAPDQHPGPAAEGFGHPWVVPQQAGDAPQGEMAADQLVHAQHGHLGPPAAAYRPNCGTLPCPAAQDPGS